MFRKAKMLPLLLLCLLLLLSACGKGAEPAPNAATENESALIEELVTFYAQYGDAAEEQNAALLERLRNLDPDAAARWEKILKIWKSANTELEIHPGVLPDGLPDTDELCLVVLGFQLNPDGSMRDELVERLQVALATAEKYPNALIVCTGGGTASGNASATEAGCMAQYLIGHGVAPERILVEDRSQTTAQNAAFTCQLLAEQYPQVRQLAILSSDYHIATGVLLFSAQATLTAEEVGKERYTVVSNAAWPAPSGSLSPMFQAGALIELAGDVKTAYEIYYDTYDIHPLPSPESAAK